MSVVHVTALSVLGSYAATHLLPAYPYVPKSFTANFVILWLTLSITSLLFHIFIYHRWFSPLRHFPSAAGGSAWNGQSKRIYTEGNGYPAMDWLNSTPHEHMFRYLGILNSERIVVTSAEALNEVTTRNFDFPKSKQARLVAEDLLGRGLVLTDAEEHKQQRKMLLPSFSARNIRALYPCFWSKSKEVVEAITNITERTGEASSEEGVEIGEWASRAALDVITQAALGMDFAAIKDPDTDLNKAYRQVFEPTRLFQFFSLLKLFIPRAVVRRIPLKQNREIMKACDSVKDTCRQIVRTQREEIARKDTSRTDLLSHILRRSGDSLLEADAVDQMMTFLAAGHETVSVGITWAIYMMCRYPEWQTKLRDEVRELAPNGLTPNSSDEEDSVVAAALLDNGINLKMFCNEVLRYWPPIPLTAREAAINTTIQGQHIPKGTKLILTIVGTNRDQRLWGDDAAEFRPERWMSESLKEEGKSLPVDALGGATSKYAFMSFNHGPRACIGAEFARAEMALIVAALVGRFEFTLVDESMLDEKNVKVSGGGFSAKPMYGMNVHMKRLGKW